MVELAKIVLTFISTGIMNPIRSLLRDFYQKATRPERSLSLVSTHKIFHQTFEHQLINSSNQIRICHHALFSERGLPPRILGEYQYYLCPGPNLSIANYQHERTRDVQLLGKILDLA